MSVAEAELAVAGYRRRQKDEWARTQRIAWVIAQCNAGKKRVDPNKIVDLSIFDDEENPFTDAETSSGDTLEEKQALIEKARRMQELVQQGKVNLAG